MSERDSICASSEKIGNDRRVRHGEHGTRLYKIWNAIKQRCLNPVAQAYRNYGGRGISICKEWLAYVTFRDWAMANGYAGNLEIDRRDNDGNYEPSNCRWVTSKENGNNRRTNTRITAFGETKSITAWSEDERCTVDRGTIRKRLLRGMSPEQAIASVHNRSEFAVARQRDSGGAFTRGLVLKISERIEPLAPAE